MLTAKQKNIHIGDVDESAQLHDSATTVVNGKTNITPAKISTKYSRICLIRHRLVNHFA